MSEHLTNTRDQTVSIPFGLGSEFRRHFDEKKEMVDNECNGVIKVPLKDEGWNATCWVFIAVVYNPDRFFLFPELRI